MDISTSSAAIEHSPSRSTATATDEEPSMRKSEGRKKTPITYRHDDD
jgi:hypothetical protein